MSSVSPITAYSQKVNFKNVTKPNFKADTENTIEVKQEKGFSKEAKIVTGVIGALALAGGITYAVMRKPSEGKKAVNTVKNGLSKDWKEAMEFFNIKQLPEHIEFKEAKTLDEALKFGKEVLGIEYCDKAKWNLDIVNYMNRGIIDVSNAMKGRVNIPERIYPFLVIPSKKIHANAGTTQMGKDLFFDANLLFGNEIETRINADLGLLDFQKMFNVKFDGKVKNLIDKYKNKELNFSEKCQLSYLLEPIEQITRNPIKILSYIKKRNPELNIDIDNINKMKLEEQITTLRKLLEDLYNNGKPLTLVIEEVSIPPYGTCYHELGHCQHSVSDYIAMNANDRKIFENKHSDFSLEKDDWDKMRDKGQIQSWHNSILEFFNTENQAIANEVSDYAKRSPAEFIAEVFARKMQGYKFSDKVEALYKKYNGPEILNPPPVKEPIWHFE